jgi:pyruvate-ferredoxin/flavodoxin oxidoreductase
MSPWQALPSKVEEKSGGEPIDQEWLLHVTGLVTQLKTLKWRYTQGTTGNGRAKMGILNATGCSSVWGSTYPFNPYPFPWANHLFQDPASMAMGVFEGHMAKMADGFKTVRLAELELSGNYDPKTHDEYLTYFNWHQFTDEEWELCPPVVAVGGDGAMFDIGFQNLSRALMSGKPIKVLILDTQVYSNTGGQACTSGFFGQVSDMAQYGKSIKGKEEIRKEMGLIGMAHRTTYVMQSAISSPNHLIEGFIQGLKARRPAMFNIYASCQPEHGIGDDRSFDQSKLAVESRAYPLFRYNPDLGKRPEDCFDLEGNPTPDLTWPTYTLKYKEGQREKTMELPMTFADFAVTEIRFRKHFRTAPPDTWNENMVPLAEFIEMPEDEREDCYPYLWSVDRKNQLTRLLVAEPIVRSCEERRDFWIMLRAIARVADGQPTEADIEAKVRQELTNRLAAGFMELMGGGKAGAVEALTQVGSGPDGATTPSAAGNG